MGLPLRTAPLSLSPTLAPCFGDFAVGLILLSVRVWLLALEFVDILIDFPDDLSVLAFGQRCLCAKAFPDFAVLLRERGRLVGIPLAGGLGLDRKSTV